MDFSTSKPCAQQQIYLYNTSKNSNGSFSSHWFSADLLDTSGFNAQLTPKTAGYFNIRLSTISDKNCNDTLLQKIMVEAQPDLQVSAKSPINLGESVFLTAEGADAYNWFPPGPLQQSSGNRVLAQPLATTVFTVVAENAAGCISTNTLAIEVIADYQLEIFNVLSLSENKLNDYFYISNISAYPDNNVKVFDQWNHLVFEQDNYQNNWNGRNANAELLAPGTYYYHISFKNSNKRYTGALLIINE